MRYVKIYQGVGYKYVCFKHFILTVFKNPNFYKQVKNILKLQNKPIM